MFDFELILRQSTRYAAMIQNSDTGGDCLGLSVEWAVNIMMGHSKTIELPALEAGHSTQREYLQMCRRLTLGLFYPDYGYFKKLEQMILQTSLTPLETKVSKTGAKIHQMLQELDHATGSRALIIGVRTAIFTHHAVALVKNKESSIIYFFDSNHGLYYLDIDDCVAGGGCYAAIRRHFMRHDGNPMFYDLQTAISINTQIKLQCPDIVIF